MQIRSLSPDLETIQLFELDQVQQATFLYPRITGFRLNYVINKAVTTSALSSLHSNSVDRFFLKAIRTSADLIVTSGETARAESLSAPSTTPLLIMTKQKLLDIPATRNPSQVPVLVTNEQLDFTNPSAKSIGFISQPLDIYLRLLTVKYPSMVLEVGLKTACALGALHLIDELCLTVTGSDSGYVALSDLAAFIEELGIEGNIKQILNVDDTWLFRLAVARSS
jgi:riboflavin biosynthesis pyrimidine reductase